MLAGLVYSPSGSAQNGVMVTCLFAAVLLLDAFDISLPRGDSIGVSGALSAAAVVVLGPVWAALICIGSVLLTHLIRYRGGEHRRIASAILGRSSALAASATAVVVFSACDAVLGRSLTTGLVPAVFLFVELVAAQLAASIGTGRPFARLIRGNLRVQSPLLVAQWSTSVLLLIAIPGMGAWTLIPVVALLFLMRQSYSMLQDIRELYRTTVEVLVEAAEGQDRRRVGHAERTAAAARDIAIRIGLTPAQVERISYAALLHDVDAICDMTELVVDADAERVVSVGSSSAVFDGVGFFDDVLPIIRVCDGDPCDQPTPADADILAGLIVALASDADAEQNSEVAAAHVGSSIDRVAPKASPAAKSLVVGAALALGYRIPAVG